MIRRISDAAFRELFRAVTLRDKPPEADEVLKVRDHYGDRPGEEHLVCGGKAPEHEVFVGEGLFAFLRSTFARDLTRFGDGDRIVVGDTAVVYVESLESLSHFEPGSHAPASSLRSPEPKASAPIGHRASNEGAAPRPVTQADLDAVAKGLSEALSRLSKEAHERHEKLSDRTGNLAKGLDEVAGIARRANDRIDEAEKERLAREAAIAGSATTLKAAMADGGGKKGKEGLEELLACIRATLGGDEPETCPCGCGRPVASSSASDEDLPPEIAALAKALGAVRVVKVTTSR